MATGKKAGLTQAELSSLLNRPQSFVSKYERGQRRLDVVEFRGSSPTAFIPFNFARLYREIP